MRNRRVLTRPCSQLDKIAHENMSNKIPRIFINSGNEYAILSSNLAEMTLRLTSITEAA